MGRGHGTQFVRAILEFARERYHASDSDCSFVSETCAQGPWRRGSGSP
jgi:hypothetical protein